MWVLHTLNKKRGNVSLKSIFKNILNRIAETPPHVDAASLIPVAPEKSA
jgi:hypothetical protein